MDHAYFTLGDARVTDECWVRFAGHEIGIPSIEQVWMVITILDEHICIRMQLNPYGQQFPVVVGGLYNDSHKTWGQSLYDLMLPMHDIATWLLRSRIDNVQAALNNLIFVDPTQVMVPDLIDRNPWGVVRTMPGSKPGDGVFIAQVPDVTRDTGMTYKPCRNSSSAYRQPVMRNRVCRRQTCVQPQRLHV